MIVSSLVDLRGLEPLTVSPGNVQFVHIEPFILEAVRTDALLVPTPLMRDWQLQTGPWLFIVGRGGAVTATFEGVASLEEVRGALVAAINSR